MFRIAMKWMSVPAIILALLLVFHNLSNEVGQNQTPIASRGLPVDVILGPNSKKSDLVKLATSPPDTDDHLQATDYDQGGALAGIRIRSNTKGMLQLYWASTGQAFDEERSVVTHLDPARMNYVLSLPGLYNIDRLRLDPLSAAGGVRLERIDIFSRNHYPIRIATREQLERLKPNRDISNLSYDGNTLAITSSGQDPMLEFGISPVRRLPKITQSGVSTRQKPAKERLQAGEGETQILPATDGHSEEMLGRPPESSETLNAICPVLSVWATATDLYHPDKGLIPNKVKRGREWEKQATIEYYEGGEKLFAATAGLRIHGGKRLQMNNSFRLYFRKSYGTDQFTPGILFSPKTEPLKRLVVHHTGWPPGWPFNNMLAYDIARQMGCNAPETKLIRLLLNGKSQGLYFLTAHLGRTQMASYFGHKNFSIFRSRSDSSNTSSRFYKEHIANLASDRSRKLNMEMVNKWIDTDHLARHIYSFVFCGTTDHCQSALVKDNRQPDSRAFWINWDMDHSFVDYHYMGQTNPPRQHWEQPGWDLVLSENPGTICLSDQLFSRLLDEDPAYRAHVIKLNMDLLNHRITEEFLLDRLDYYENMLRECGEPTKAPLRRLRQFLLNRPTYLRKEMQARFGLGPAYPCRLEGPAGVTYMVDGYPESAGYSGWYFENMPIRVELVNRGHRPLSHWRVNGVIHRTYPLSVPVEQPLTIVPVFKNEP